MVCIHFPPIDGGLPSLTLSIKLFMVSARWFWLWAVTLTSPSESQRMGRVMADEPGIVVCPTQVLSVGSGLGSGRSQL